MYLKKGLISFLKVKNVILLILGIFFTAASASNMIELIVYYFGDWFTIIHANSTPGSVFLFIIGVLMIVYSRGSRRLINDACFFSSYFEGDLNGYVDFAELAEVTGRTTSQIKSRIALLHLLYMKNFRVIKTVNYQYPEIIELYSKTVTCSCRSCGGWMEKRVYFEGRCPYCGSSNLTAQVVSGQRVYFINDNAGSFDEGGTQVPLRYTALTSILNRCEISGDGIKKLFLSDKEYFAKYLNRYLSLKDNAKRQMLALVQDGKLSALHSKAYTPISQTDVFDLVEDYLQDFDNAEFLTAEWSWEQTQAVYEIRDNDLLSVYRKLLQKHFPGKKDCAVRMRAISSDVAEAAVRFNTFLLIGSLSLPLGGSISVKHMGKVTIETVQEKMKGIFSSFEASCRSLAGLADIPIRHKKNAMIKIFTDLHIPQRYAAEICERYDNTLTNALDVYSSLAEVLIAMKGKVAASALFSYEEALARVITYPRNRWSSFDIPGVVAWGAASKALSKIA